MKIWVDGALRDADDARVSVFDHGLTVGDGVFETVKAVDGRPVRAHPAPRPAGPLGPRPRPARPRPRRGAPRLRRGPGGQPDAARAGCASPTPAASRPLGSDRGDARARPWSSPSARPPRRPDTDRRRHRAVDPQRARRAHRPEDHLVRRERRRARPRPASTAPPRRCSPTPSGSSARAPAPTSSSSSTASCTPRRSPPAAWPASPAPWSSSGPGPRRRDLPLDVAGRGRGDLPDLHPARRPGRAPGRRPRTAGAPGPVTAKAMRIFAERAGDDLDP